MKSKNEVGNHYKDFRIISEYPEREPSNGCVKWVCECINCGTIEIKNGNLLRTGQTAGVCMKCRARNKRKKRWT